MTLFGVIKQQSAGTLWWTYFFGAMWGFGGLTFGLTMRYLGMSLGMGVALGYCAAFGTLLPPIFKLFIPTIPVAETIAQIASTTPGKITLLGVFVCLAGIAVAAYAGLTKEREMPAEEKKKAIKEFNFTKGIMVATFSGIMSACFSFALTAGKPIGDASHWLRAPRRIWTGLAKLVVVLLGGFTTNFIWCVLLNIKNRTGYQYLASHVRAEHAQHWRPRAASEPGGAAVAHRAVGLQDADDRQLSCSPRWRAPAGISSSSSTRWARRRWASIVSPRGRCTWPASSSSARCGAGFSTNGRVPARRPICSSAAALLR